MGPGGVGPGGITHIQLGRDASDKTLTTYWGREKCIYSIN